LDEDLGGVKMTLPRCLFCIRASSGIPAAAVDDLVRHADDVYRLLDLVTDLPVSVAATTDAVNVVPWPEPGKMRGLLRHKPPYDVILWAMPEATREGLAYEGKEHHPYLSSPEMGAPDCWTCWVEPRGEAVETPYDVVEKSVAQTFAAGVKAHWAPRVAGFIGPPMDVIFTPLALFGTPSPATDWTAMWGVVFRASGKYVARIETRHVDL